MPPPISGDPRPDPDKRVWASIGAGFAVLLATARSGVTEAPVGARSVWSGFRFRPSTEPSADQAIWRG
jgi:hypothetical protein